MTQQEFLKHIHKRLSQISIGASAIRNQGAPGLVEKTRKYLETEIELSHLFERLADEKQLQIFLNKHTEQLVDRYPIEAKSWGAARKGLSLFFREVVYNKFLADDFGLPQNFKKFNRVVRHLELPLDKDVGTALYNNSNKQIPRWTSIKKLTFELSSIYQAKAKEIADEKEIARIHLDLEYWRPRLK